MQVQKCSPILYIINKQLKCKYINVFLFVGK